MHDGSVSNFGKNLALWVIIGLLLVALFNLFHQPSGRSGESGMAYSDFLTAVENGEIRKVVIEGNDIIGEGSQGERGEEGEGESP